MGKSIIKKLIFFLLIFFISLPYYGCAPREIKLDKFEPVKFEKTEPYKLDLSTLNKPEMLKPIFIDKNFKEASIDKAEYVLLLPEEYAKINGILKLAKAYKDVALEEEVLVNNYIDIINSLKEYIKIEQEKARAYQELYVAVENTYRYEQYLNGVERKINQGLFSVISIGTLIAVIVAL